MLLVGSYGNWEIFLAKSMCLTESREYKSIHTISIYIGQGEEELSLKTKFQSLISLNGRLERGRYCFSAVLLAVLYAVSLHPATGFLGGLIYLLTSWAIPSIIVVLLAFWLSSYGKNKAVKITIFIIMSTLLGLNTKIPTIIGQLAIRPTGTWHVERALKYPVNFDDSIQIGGHDRIRASLLLPMYIAGGNEGCMCMYFEKSRSSLYVHDLRKASGVRGWGGGSIASALERAKRHSRVTFAYSEVVESGNRTATAIFQIFDGKGEVGYFKQRGLPIDLSSLPRFKGLDFITTTLDMLMHDNIWIRFADLNVPHYFAQQDFDEFKKRVNFDVIWRVMPPDDY